MKKKLLSILLSLAMVITMMPMATMTAFAADDNSPSAIVMLKATTSGNNAVKLSWTKAEAATKYVVYGNKCGKSFKKLATVKSNKYTVKKIGKTKLAAHKFYKFKVVAYNDSVKLATSKTIHFITGKTSGMYANASKITATTPELTLEVGQTAKVGATVEIYKNKNHIPSDHGSKLRYVSDNTAVATVSSKGEVKAVSEGTATIYIQDVGGLYCKTIVNVEDNRDKEAFESYKQEVIDKCEALSKLTDTKGIKTMIADAKAGIDALAYDKTQTLEENKAAVDAVYTNLVEKVKTQRIKQGLTLAALTAITGIIFHEIITPDPGTKTYTVTFELNGHGSAIDSVTVNHGSKVTAPTVPTAEGYTFDGWYKEAGCTNAWNFDSDKVTEDTILYAKWTADIYTISLDVNEGTGGATSTTITYGATKTTTFTAPTAPTGKKLDGWYTAVTDGTKVLDAEGNCIKSVSGHTDTEGRWTKVITEAEPLTLHAVWKDIPTTFKAVYNTKDGVNTLTFYYDNVEHSGDNITVYENGTANYLFDDTKYQGAQWGYNSIRNSIKKVVIDNSVKTYEGLTSTAYMFYYMSNAEHITGAEHLDVSNVTNMSSMFHAFGDECKTLNEVPNVSTWDTSNVTDMSCMFEYYNGTAYPSVLTKTPDVSNWNTSNVTNVSGMFNSYAYNNEEINFTLDFSKWDISKVKYYENMFADAAYATSNKSVTIPVETKLKDGGTKPNTENEWYLSDGTSFIEPPEGCTFTSPSTFKAVYDTNDGNNTLTFYYDADDHSGDNITVYDNLPVAATKASDWGYSSKSSYVKSVVIDSSVAKYKDLTSTVGMFAYMSSAASINGAEYLDTSNVTTMKEMFYFFGSNSEELNTVPNVENWDTSKVTDMSELFDSYGSKSTTFNAVPDVSNWNLSNCTTIQSMFDCYGRNSTELSKVPSVGKWNTLKITKMNRAFAYYGASSTKLDEVPDVSTWNTDSVRDLSSMFSNYCQGKNSSLSKLPKVDNWDVSKVLYVESMFESYGEYSTALEFKLNLSKWNIVKVKYPKDMFKTTNGPAKWEVTIPAKTGNINNTIEKWYGSSTSYSVIPLNKDGICTKVFKIEGSTTAKDVLEMSENPIPTGMTSIPENAWKYNSNTCHIDGMNNMMMFRTSGAIALVYLGFPVEKSGTNYTMEIKKPYCNSTGSITFVMDGEKLVSIVLTDDEHTELSGTYAPASN